MFCFCFSLESLNALKNWDVSKANYIEYMFSGCHSLKSLDGLDEWNINTINIWRIPRVRAQEFEVGIIPLYKNI